MNEWKEAFTIQESKVNNLRNDIYGTDDFREMRTLFTEQWEQAFRPFPTSSTSHQFNGTHTRADRAGRVAAQLAELKAAHDKLYKQVSVFAQGRTLPEDKSVILELLKLFGQYLMTLTTQPK